MYATVHIHFSKDIPEDQLFSRLPCSADHSTALQRTVFNNDPEAVKLARHSLIRPSSVSIIFAEGAQSYQVHVESTVGSTSITKLKIEAQNFLRAIADSAYRKKCKCDAVTIGIYAESNLISQGHKVDRLRKIGTRFRETVLNNAVIAVIIGVTVYLLGLDPGRSLVAGLAAVISFLIWLVAEVLSKVKEYEYEDA
jgi:hypothetical protein